MKISTGDWVTYKNTPNKLPLMVIQYNDRFVSLIEMNDHKPFIFDTPKDTFELFYYKCHPDFYSFDLKFIADCYKVAMVFIAEKIKEEQNKIDSIKSLQLENQNLKRQNKILQVIAKNNRQSFWKKGKIIPNRVAECQYCHQMLLSEDSLPFFKYQPEQDTDSFYCGCRGWD